MIRLESDEEAVRIATIHKSKGLEYPIVFCPFNWRSSGIGPQRSHEQPFLFHDPEHGFAPTLALGKEAIERFRSIAEEEALAENMRLLYVALTRAKSRCYCIWCNGKSADIAGLSWLLFGATLGKPCVPKLIEAMTALDPAQASGMIRDRMQGAERVFLLEPLPYSSPQQRIPPDTESVIAECRKFSGRIPPPRLVHSYSSLAHQVEGPRVDAPDYDLFPTGIAMIENAPVNRFVSIIDFPRGAKAGTFLHEIFELLDFSSISKIEPALPDLLARKGFEPSWAGVITDLAHDISALRLDPNTDLSLSAISAEQCIKEMEFYFPLKPFSLPDLYRLTGEQSDGISHFGLAEAGGFMKGFIDLIFEWKGRYYIVDWKSNYLGSAAEDYLPEALRAVMEREHYLLQYHLYIVALHNYLALRLPGYRYDDHFGGVYYLFLRGIGKDPHSRNGVFFDRPEMIKIAGFKSLLSKYR
jgi:exodeoxyribonuclease V beta subunit